MPELPEVEVLVRHLGPLIKGKRIEQVTVHRPKILKPTSAARFRRELEGSVFWDVSRRGKYLVFSLHRPGRTDLQVLGHLGMTGRMYLLPEKVPLPKHAAVVLGLKGGRFVFEDTRYFGRFTLDLSALAQLGPEPLEGSFTPEVLRTGLRRSSQPVKVKLLDQSLIAGIGNIYASEALFRAGISPTQPARRVSAAQTEMLWRSIREVLQEAIAAGSTIPLDYAGAKQSDGLFYFGSAAKAGKTYEERLLVYDRKDLPCTKCGEPIVRLVQAARSTFYCRKCQGGNAGITCAARRGRGNRGKSGTSR